MTNVYIKRVPNTINHTSAGDRTPEKNTSPGDKTPEIKHDHRTRHQRPNMIIGQDTRNHTSPGDKTPETKHDHRTGHQRSNNMKMGQDARDQTRS